MAYKHTGKSKLNTSLAGYTLIEITVTAVVIALTTVLAIVSYNKYVNKARETVPTNYAITLSKQIDFDLNNNLAWPEQEKIFNIPAPESKYIRRAVYRRNSGNFNILNFVPNFNSYFSHDSSLIKGYIALELADNSGTLYYLGVENNDQATWTLMKVAGSAGSGSTSSGSTSSGSTSSGSTSSGSTSSGSTSSGSTSSGSTSSGSTSSGSTSSGSTSSSSTSSGSTSSGSTSSGSTSSGSTSSSSTSSGSTSSGSTSSGSTSSGSTSSGSTSSGSTSSSSTSSGSTSSGTSACLIQNCSNCDGSVCLNCMSGFYLNNGVCNVCPQYAFCSGGTDFTCGTNFIKSTNGCSCSGYVSGEGQDMVCNNCPDNCQSCNSSGCINCSSNYYLNNGSCNSCPQNASCNGSENFNCATNFTKLANDCTCAGVISGSGIDATCNICEGNKWWTKNYDFRINPPFQGYKCVNCPLNSVCSNGKIIGCTGTGSETRYGTLYVSCVCDNHGYLIMGGKPVTLDSDCDALCRNEGRPYSICGPLCSGGQC